jgi:hypothetical protein
MGAREGLDWMEKAFAHNKGAMTRSAEREGVSNAQYEKEHEHSKGKAGRRARAALNAKRANRK